MQLPCCRSTVQAPPLLEPGHLRTSRQTAKTSSQDRQSRPTSLQRDSLPPCCASTGYLRSGTTTAPIRVVIVSADRQYTVCLPTASQTIEGIFSLDC
jgi:hypothetical protein